MLTEDQMRWPASANAAAVPGWTAVLTPLGASLHVLVNSQAWDVCTEWQLLHSGRGLLSPTDPRAWFSNDELAKTPPGLVAELFAHASRLEAFLDLIAKSAEARAHMLQLPDHLYAAEPDEWVHVGKYLDLVRCFDERTLAQAAANKPMKG